MFLNFWVLSWLFAVCLFVPSCKKQVSGGNMGMEVIEGRRSGWEGDFIRNNSVVMFL